LIAPRDPPPFCWCCCAVLISWLAGSDTGNDQGLSLQNVYTGMYFMIAPLTRPHFVDVLVRGEISWLAGCDAGNDQGLSLQ
jgi:hypothetical protein